MAIPGQPVLIGRWKSRGARAVVQGPFFWRWCLDRHRHAVVLQRVTWGRSPGGGLGAWFTKHVPAARWCGSAAQPRAN